ncbi:hypothetical protein TRFO_06379 [Tritrichomonas foetus]|uniref:Borealin N-terminal domain-containing protein n=1 Tax=Tritrichomonas foetus TaxID=1144522 RepID=A0A1J4K3Y4_9EUKA|nr:hypothetical protein TRFO_06379 [Tritrichomonas foetus]|eukprot:OHT04468.1 hypothetical protein TRFO_06379 [Tritrichomonas foetus]
MENSDAEANSLIQEFDQEVDKRCKMIRSSAENTSDNMRNALGLILGSIPECVRKMPLKALVQNFNGDIQAATAYFCPKGHAGSKSPRSKKGSKRNLPLTQTMSLSDLLKQQAATAAGLPPPAPRTPTKMSSTGNLRTPTKTSRGTPSSGSKSPMQSSSAKVPRSSPRTPTHSGKKFF